MRIKEAYIVIERGRIKRIGREPYGEGSGYQLNCEGLVVSPGYIDTHIHGLEGIDVLEATCDDILELGYKLVEHGVTSFLPTVAAAPHEDLLRVCRTVREAHESWNYKRGARVLGLYLEGPYVNPVKRGGQDERFIRGPSIKELEDYIRASGGLVRQITIAPELEGALDLISYASSRGIVVCIGHTMATYDETMLAIAAGARKATHIFNTMRSFHHREPGVALALLLSPSTFIEVNADFVHLHPATVRFAISLAGPDRVVLITDTSKVARLPDGEYVVRGMRIIVKEGIPRLAESGVLYGSFITLDDAVRNVHSLGYSLEECFTMASYTPSRSIEADVREKIGLIAPGWRGDLIVLDERLRVVKTIIDGNLVYERD